VNLSSIFCMIGMAWHWPDHHWQCNRRVAWTSSRKCASKRRTLRATVVTIFSHMIRDVSVFVKCDAIFRLLFWKLPQIRTSKFRKVVWQHTEGMVRSIIWILLEIYLSILQWKNFGNPLTLMTKLSPWVWCTTFFGHSVGMDHTVSPANYTIPAFTS